ncbi:hypothetical protein ME7_01495 [Bartonella birtlesii LL-WM9]|uniref:Lipoprotein n=1 Tax=Bartonella birtlesii LL-WM9 TaxID=1094552 RepID=J1IS35_9HYPH|nr:hypothetical protein ME7_01495 [Bartonella birtlesii LL-WM9]
MINKIRNVFYVAAFMRYKTEYIAIITIVFILSGCFNIGAEKAKKMRDFIIR